MQIGDTFFFFFFFFFFLLLLLLFKYIENFTTQNWKVSDKNSDFFFIFLLKT